MDDSSKLESSGAGNIYPNRGKVTAEQRETRNGHMGGVVWLTGLSGSGKSTIAVELEHQLFKLGWHVYILDGDSMRRGLCSDLTFSPEDRMENIRRAEKTGRVKAVGARPGDSLAVDAVILEFE